MTKERKKNIRECTTEEVCRMLSRLKQRIVGIKSNSDDLPQEDIIDEAIRRLEIKPRVPFNDEQFDV